jgi:hypothetical protein
VRRPLRLARLASNLSAAQRQEFRDYFRRSKYKRRERRRPWITAAKPTYTKLIDEQHAVSKLYNMVNVPTGVWINEEGKIVRPNEVAFVDDRFKTFLCAQDQKF